MRNYTLLLFAASALCALAAEAGAHANYIGYSGAPGSNGTCAATCHGSGGGTVQASGFPTEYVPGQIYAITVSHSGGATIKQFNGSCRVGAGSVNAGVIAAGTNTATYNTGVETNGIHLSANDQDSGTFNWTAPAIGTGEVRLYIAGHQGSAGGANTSFVLAATEQTVSVPDEIAGLAGSGLQGNYPNPFRSHTTIRYRLAQQAAVRLEIFDVLGQVLTTMSGTEPAGPHQFTWDASDRASGVYYYRLQVGDSIATRRMLLEK